MIFGVASADEKGTRVFNRHFDPFNLIIDHGSKTLFVLNPKVMTSFARKMLVDGMQEFHQKSDLSDGRYRWLTNAKNFPVQPLRTYARLALGQGDFVAYSIVRNPFTRTFSAWRDKFFDPHVRGSGALSAYPPSMRKGELLTFRKFARVRGLEGKDPESLVPFSTFLKKIAAQREGHRNHHWDTQSSVIQFQHFEFSQCFRMEDQRKDCFETVFGRMGFDREWIATRMNRRANPSSTDSAKLISKNDIALIRQIFDVDFDNFGYSRDVPGALARYLE